MTLTEFLLARIAEDEAHLPEGFDCWYEPERYRAECEAKRRVLDLWEEACNYGYATSEEYLERAAMALALPYADHPDYRDEWRP